MPITVVQAAPTVNASSLTTASVTLASPTTAGNTLVACVTTFAATTLPAVSGLTLGGAADHWQAAVTGAGATWAGGAIWFDPNCAGGQTAVVVNCTGGSGANGQIYIAVYEISGVLFSDRSSIGEASTGAPVTSWSSGATGTTANPAEIFIAAAMGSTSIPTVTGAGTWVTQSTGLGSFDQISGTQIVSATGTATFSGTMSSGAYIALVVTFYGPAVPVAPAVAVSPGWFPGAPAAPGGTPFPPVPPQVTATVNPVPLNVTPPLPGPAPGWFPGAPGLPAGTPFPAAPPQVTSLVSLYARTYPAVYGGAEAPLQVPVPATSAGWFPAAPGLPGGLPFAAAPPVVTPAAVTTAAAVAARRGPVQARQRPARGGSVTSRDGTFQGTGPPLKAPDGPVQARPGPQRGGTADSRTGLFSGSGPRLRALASAVTARLRALPPRGRTAARAGVYGQAGPPVKAAAGPVAVRQLPRRGGSATARAGTFTAGGPQTGPPIYPLGHPVTARRLSQRGGNADSRAGVFAGLGPPVPVLKQPIGVYRRQPPPPVRGRVVSLDGIRAGTGPPVPPLHRAVRAQPQAPVLYGRTDSRVGIAVFVPPPAFTIGTLTASGAPAAVLTAAGAASALSAVTAPLAAYTAATAAGNKTDVSPVQDEAGNNVLDEVGGQLR